MYNKGLFANWVPKPIMLLLVIVFIIPILVVSGSYTTNIPDVVGGMGIYAEVVSMANYSTTIGMGVAMPIVLRVKLRFRSVEIMMVCMSILGILCYMCATTDSEVVLLASSFFIGFFKMFPMMELLLLFMFIVSPTGEKGRFYTFFYTFVILIVQVSGYVLSIFAYDYGWQTIYFVMSIYMLFVALLSWIFVHRNRFSFKVPLYYIDWFTMLLLAISMMSFNFFFSFMKQQGWMSSIYIKISLLIGIVFFLFVVLRQTFLKRKYISFKLFKRENIRHSLMLLMFSGVFLASTSILTQYTVGILGYTNMINAKLNLWMIPGIILGCVISFYCFKHKWHLKYFILGGFIAFFLHVFMLYLTIQPQMNIEHLYLPMFFKGLGMGILFIGIWYYGSLYLEMEEMFGVLGIMLIVRTFFATAGAGALISYLSYQGQWQSLSDMSMYWDSTSISPSAAMQLYPVAQVNAVLNSFKIILGGMCLLILPIVLYVSLHHYGKISHKKLEIYLRLIRRKHKKGFKFKIGF